MRAGCSATVRLVSGVCSAAVRCTIKSRFGACTLMDNRFKEILDNLPPKRPRSRLEPYAELVEELRRRGTTYRNIALILTEKCPLKVSASTVHDFVRVRSRKNIGGTRQRPVVSKISPSVAAGRAARNTEGNGPPADDVQRRIAELKLRSAPVSAKPKGFHYNPEEPLRLPLKPLKKGS